MGALLATEERTMIFYESPYRVAKTLENFVEYFGANRQCCVSRELSKMFEENKRGTVDELLQYYKTNTIKGEVVIVVEGLK